MSKTKKNAFGMGHNSGATSERLKSIVERIERLEEEKANIAADIRDVYAEAKGTGFDTKTIRNIIKQRKLSEQERAEQDALLDLYKAALGMLDGTPLGSAAIDRLKKQQVKEEDPERGDQQEETSTAKPTEQDIERARADGHDAARKKKSVTSNPHPAHDPRRAAWDEGWCQASGSDGMDIPDAWRPSKKPKKGDDEKDDAA